MEPWKFTLGDAAWLSFVAPVAAALLGWMEGAAAFWLIRRASRRTVSDLGAWIATHLRRPSLLLASILALRLSLPAAELSETSLEIVRHSLAMLLILTVGWLLIALTSVLDEYLDKRFVLDMRDNLTARRVHTKFAVVRRVLIIVVSVVTGGALLMTFPAVRHLGGGLFASAGIAGIVLGIAARPTVEALIAGGQLALTEPIRVDDAVIVEGEWSRVVEASRLWDRRFWNLQVVEVGERTIRLRVLVSAADASTAWNLRCEVREKLLGYLQTHHPEALPRLRATVATTPDIPPPQRGEPMA